MNSYPRSSASNMKFLVAVQPRCVFFLNIGAHEWTSCLWISIIYEERDGGPSVPYWLFSWIRAPKELLYEE